jgi:predicted amidophosphoribosyltransferase
MMRAEAKTLLNKKLSDFFSFILGSTCPACGCLASQVCSQCLKSIRLNDSVSKQIVEYHDKVIVAYAYSNVIRKVILGFKYRNQRSSLRFLGDALVDRLVVEKSRSLCKIDLITWAPTTDLRKIERGHDHAELVARYVAKQLQISCRKVLTRLSDHPQTGKSRDARLVGPVFTAQKLNAEHVLINSASHALYQAGAGLVTCMAVASTVLWQSSIGSYALAKARK